VQILAAERCHGVHLHHCYLPVAAIGTIPAGHGPARRCGTDDRPATVGRP